MGEEGRKLGQTLGTLHQVLKTSDAEGLQVPPPSLVMCRLQGSCRRHTFEQMRQIAGASPLGSQTTAPALLLPRLFCQHGKSVM